MMLTGIANIIFFNKLLTFIEVLVLKGKSSTIYNMKTIIKLIIFTVFIGNCQPAEAQFLKKLKKKAQDKITEVENKVIDKVENKADKAIDDVLNGDKNSKKDQSEEIDDESNVDVNTDFGDVIIKHNNNFGSVLIKEISKIKISKSANSYRVNGTWWSHEADIFDGFVLNIKTTENLKHDDENNANNGKLKVFKIPEEATLQLGYDPNLPYFKAAESNDDNFIAAVSDDYQNYEISKGEVSIDVLTDDAIQISFLGKVTLKKMIKSTSTIDDYSEQFFESTITGGIDGVSPEFINNSSIQNKKEEKQAANTNTVKKKSSANGTSTIYNFTHETVVEITSPEEDKTYKISYLLNSNENYVGIKADMSEYTEAEMDGESIIIMDDNTAHVFVETAGMKMQMSGVDMGGQQMKNPSDQMSNYDYANLKKTGKTKIILGATCYEYVMSDDATSIQLWVAPSINLPNWFGADSEAIDGHIMAYNVKSKEGNITSETIAIKDNISITINPKDYKKMF